VIDHLVEATGVVDDLLLDADQPASPISTPRSPRATITRRWRGSDVASIVRHRFGALDLGDQPHRCRRRRAAAGAPRMSSASRGKETAT
jgi:hypothetical protein